MSTLALEEPIRELAEEYSIMIFTHNMQQAARLSNCTAFLMADDARIGHLVEYGESNPGPT